MAALQVRNSYIYICTPLAFRNMPTWLLSSWQSMNFQLLVFGCPAKIWSPNVVVYLSRRMEKQAQKKIQHEMDLGLVYGLKGVLVRR